jgi:vacuolar-type H+-ATPase subunit I/STV1
VTEIRGPDGPRSPVAEEVTRPDPDQARPVERADVQPEQPVTGWVVWMFFAGGMLVLIGVIQVITGLVSLFRDQVYAVRPDRLLVDVSYNVWGWTHLVLGVLLVVLGYAVLSARSWARFTAVGLAGISAIVNFLFLPAYPVWAVIVIALDLIVVFALLVHGGELRMGSEHY